MTFRYLLISLLAMGTSSAWAATEVPQGLRCLVEAYPDKIEVGADGNSVLWRDGTVMVYDDGTQRTPQEQFDNADLRDMMRLNYPRGDAYPNPPPAWFDPGRNRNEAFFKKLYGGNANEVSSQLTNVRWWPDPRLTVSFTRVAGASAQLQALAVELANLRVAQPALMPFLTGPLGGTFNWRNIAGTNKLSVHSFGAAIDINISSSDYWHDAGANAVYRNRIPLAIAEVFERHGFIWGGKWQHFDTMHFEYRPELLLNSASCARP